MWLLSLVVNLVCNRSSLNSGLQSSWPPRKSTLSGWSLHPSVPITSPSQLLQPASKVGTAPSPPRLSLYGLYVIVVNSDSSPSNALTCIGGSEISNSHLRLESTSSAAKDLVWSTQIQHSTIWMPSFTLTPICTINPTLPNPMHPSLPLSCSLRPSTFVTCFFCLIPYLLLHVLNHPSSNVGSEANTPDRNSKIQPLLVEIDCLRRSRAPAASPHLLQERKWLRRRLRRPPPPPHSDP